MSTRRADVGANAGKTDWAVSPADFYDILRRKNGGRDKSLPDKLIRTSKILVVWAWGFFVCVLVSVRGGLRLSFLFRPAAFFARAVPASVVTPAGGGKARVTVKLAAMENRQTGLPLADKAVVRPVKAILAGAYQRVALTAAQVGVRAAGQTAYKTAAANNGQA